MGLVPQALVLKFSHTGRAAKFWTQGLGYERQADAPEFLVPPTGQGVRILWTTATARTSTCGSTGRRPTSTPRLTA